MDVTVVFAVERDLANKGKLYHKIQIIQWEPVKPSTTPDVDVRLLTKIGTLPSLQTHLLSIRCKVALNKAGSQDISNYAKDRRRVWLFGEPDLRKNVIAVKAAYRDHYFENLRLNLAPSSHFGLVAQVLIKPHRDHRYSIGPTWSITTKSCLFEIWPRETSLKDCKQGTGELHQLQAGDISSFHSKCPHAVWEMEPERVSVTFWEARPEWVNLI